METARRSPARWGDDANGARGSFGIGDRVVSRRAPMEGWKVVYKVTYPNGRIRVGHDVTEQTIESSAASMRSWSPRISRESSARISPGARRSSGRSDSATDEGLTRRKLEFVRELRANDPAVGYNRKPKFKPEVK
jgi:hypothetical protein